MKIGPPALLLASALLIAACSNDVPPVVLAGAQADYFGSWEHVGSEYGNNIESDNMLLVFHPDSTVSYKRCIKRMTGHNYTTLPGADIKSLTDRQLVISGGIWFINFTRELPINKPPHAEGEESYLEVDGLKLRKLKSGESSTHETWKCDSD
jgi:hypothetical protein